MIKVSRFIVVLFACTQSIVSCAQVKPAVTAGEAAPVAFPGAEGFGRFTTGGRGGAVKVVTNLEDDGPGSLRDAVNGKKPKTVVFAVSGTIHLRSKLNIGGNTTIAGQTAPGGGICLADHAVSITGDNVIVRYLRFRMGDRYQNTGMVNGAGSDDAFGAQGRKHIIIDHCSMSWSTDEAFSVYNGDSTTLQWNLVSEPLNYSYHFETGDKDFENHGYGGIWGGRHLSAHHNLFAHCISRTPRLNGIRQQGEDFVDFRNNVIYNWGHNNVYAGEGGTYNIVNNYYRPGPGTNPKVKARIVNPGRNEKIGFGTFYVAGNFVEDAPEVTANNTLGVHPDKDADKTGILKPVPFDAVPLGMQSPKDAFTSVLANVGAVLPARDSLDVRVLNDVRNRTGRYIDVQGGFPHGTPYEQTVKAWPALISAPAPADSDADGIPDEWEQKNGLDPKDASDATKVGKSAYYTNIELYINSLVK
jgi:pectate lyase